MWKWGLKKRGNDSLPLSAQGDGINFKLMQHVQNETFSKPIFFGFLELFNRRVAAVDGINGKEAILACMGLISM
jgi:hypothetical protein